MGMMTNHQGIMFRLNGEKNTVEYSTTNGRSWHQKHKFSDSQGQVSDIMDNGNELLVTTTKALFYSTTKGQSFHKR